MPATSKSQFRFMQGICHGNITPPKGFSREKACEFVSGQSSKGLPEKKRKYIKKKLKK